MAADEAPLSPGRGAERTVVCCTVATPRAGTPASHRRAARLQSVAPDEYRVAAVDARHPGAGVWGGIELVPDAHTVANCDLRAHRRRIPAFPTPAAATSPQEVPVKAYDHVRAALQRRIADAAGASPLPPIRWGRLTAAFAVAFEEVSAGRPGTLVWIWRDAAVPAVRHAHRSLRSAYARVGAPAAAVQEPCLTEPAEGSVEPPLRHVVGAYSVGGYLHTPENLWAAIVRPPAGLSSSQQPLCASSVHQMPWVTGVSTRNTCAAPAWALVLAAQVWYADFGALPEASTSEASWDVVDVLLSALLAHAGLNVLAVFGPRLSSLKSAPLRQLWRLEAADRSAPALRAVRPAFQTALAEHPAASVVWAAMRQADQRLAQARGRITAAARAGRKATAAATDSGVALVGAVGGWWAARPWKRFPLAAAAAAAVDAADPARAAWWDAMGSRWDPEDLPSFAAEALAACPAGALVCLACAVFLAVVFACARFLDARWRRRRKP